MTYERTLSLSYNKIGNNYWFHVSKKNLYKWNNYDVRTLWVQFVKTLGNNVSNFAYKKKQLNS